MECLLIDVSSYLRDSSYRCMNTFMLECCFYAYAAELNIFMEFHLKQSKSYCSWNIMQLSFSIHVNFFMYYIYMCIRKKESMEVVAKQWHRSN
jgi:hypothetical protein